MNKIGLEQKSSVNVAAKLNELLADYHIFYMNVRGFHWNIKGENFFILHEKFEELYDDLFEKIDEIAERILTLGETPLHSYSAYIKQANIKEAIDFTTAKATVSSVVTSFEVLLKKQRQILELAGTVDDEGTNALMSDYISQQEKLVWMYSAFLAK